MALRNRNTDAVGQGVSRQGMDRFLSGGKPPPMPKPMPLPEIKKWVDKPTIADQSNNPELYRIVGCETKMFDFSKEDQLKEWNVLQNECQQPDTNRFIVERKLEFARGAGVWKVLVTIQRVEYLQLLAGAQSKHVGQRSNGSDN